jgi:hypothetical protein
MLAEFLHRLGRSEWHKKAYMLGIYASYILFAIAFTGAMTINPKYMMLLETIIRYYVCAFLLIRFNPLSYKKSYSAAAIEFDRRMAFSAGIFLLLTSTITDLAHAYVKKARATFENVVDVSLDRHESA